MCVLVSGKMNVPIMVHMEDDKGGNGSSDDETYNLSNFDSVELDDSDIESTGLKDQGGMS